MSKKNRFICDKKIKIFELKLIITMQLNLICLDLDSNEIPYEYGYSNCHG